jgi:3-deoxy-D-manno-octulosonic-acid transferase
VNRLDPLYLVLAGITAPLWARKARARWGERLGRIDAVPDRSLSGGGEQARPPRILLHAVSVGEVNALRELTPLLAAEAQVIISASTDTGLKQARELFSVSCDVVRYPLDFSWAVRRFLNAVRPDVVALTELELWPNFVAECVRRKVPVGVINGRLSARSFKGYSKLRRFFRPVFSALEFAAVQDEAYAERFEYMGVDPGRCVITGSMKWDTARIEDDVPGAAELAREMGIARGAGAPPLVVAGSTAEGEESLLHRVCGELGDVQLLCAPRKPERFNEAAAAMPGCRRRSQGAGGRGHGSGGGGQDGQPEGPPRRFLLDTIGELRKAYALADVVVMGRTFGKLYGSDPVEPIGLGKATIVGPAMSDFEQIFRAFDAAGGIVQTTEAELARVLGNLLRDEGRRRELAELGRVCIREHQGASARHAELIMSLVRRE